jgi:hypothetical protein
MCEGKVSLFDEAPFQETLRTLGSTAALILNPGTVDVNDQLHSSISLCPLKNPIAPLNRRLEGSESQS